MTEHKQAFREYFKVFYKWNAITFTLVFAVYLLVLLDLTNASWGKYWVIPVAYIAVLLVNIRFFILYFKAISDLKKGRIEKKTVIFSEIECDYRYSFRKIDNYNKTLIKDSEGAEYRASFSDWKIKAELYLYLLEAEVEIEFLSSSKIILTHNVIRYGKPFQQNRKNRNHREWL